MCTNFGTRLKKEREKTSLSQEIFGEKCGISKRSQINYESCVRKPDVEYLNLAAKLGCDVQFIVTGQCSNGGLTVHENVGLNSDVLADAIETVTNIFERIKRKPKNKQQLAQIISAVYELQLENGNSDSQQDTILRLIKAAS